MFIGQRVNTFMCGHYYNSPKKADKFEDVDSLLVGEVEGVWVFRGRTGDFTDNDLCPWKNRQGV